MEENPNTHPDYEYLKFMVDCRYREADQHLRVYGLLMTANLATFAAALAYLTNASPVDVWIRIMMSVLGLLLCFAWWAGSTLTSRKIEVWRNQSMHLATRIENLPSELVRAVTAQPMLAASDEPFFPQWRLLAVHLPVGGMSIAWVLIVVLFSPATGTNP